MGKKTTFARLKSWLIFPYCFSCVGGAEHSMRWSILRVNLWSRLVRPRDGVFHTWIYMASEVFVETSVLVGVYAYTLG